MKSTILFYTLIILLTLTACNSSNNQQQKKQANEPSLIESQKLIKTTNKKGMEIETYEIQYLSDGLKITGYINKPKNDEAYPALLFLRGGNRDYGVIGKKLLNIQRNLAAEGFIVLSTQLRGNKYSEGVDELGGKDLNDILQLIKIAKSLPYVKNQLVGIHGFSRGGMNAYQISRMSDEIKSVSVLGAPVDLRDSHAYRPGMYEQVHLPLVGDTISQKEEYDKRAPILWADEINEPIMILHGKADTKVKLVAAEKMLAQLKAANAIVEHHFIEDGGHGLMSQSKLRDSLIVNWHKKYLK